MVWSARDNNQNYPAGEPQSPQPPYQPPAPGAAAGPTGAPAANGQPGGPYPPAGPGFSPAPPAPAAPGPQGYAPPAPNKKKHSRPIELAILAAALAFLLFAILCFVSLLSLGGSLRAWITPSSRSNATPRNSFSVIQVVGDIQNSPSDRYGIQTPSYYHAATVQYVKELAEEPDNNGILLYMNTGGGGVYESDELYNALMDYKETTGRPVWAFMGSACASGGYYVCMAADQITATPNTTTGSIGVYIALTDTSGLYEKLGIDTVLVRSGANKGIGTPGVEITPEQIAIYQSSVDEKYEQFVELIVQGRAMDKDTVYKLGDGRPYTGKQALENGLVDELGAWDDLLEEFEETTGAQPFYPSFSSSTGLGSLISSLRSALPKGDAEAALEAAQQTPSGVPMYYVPGLV